MQETTELNYLTSGVKIIFFHHCGKGEIDEKCQYWFILIGILFIIIASMRENASRMGGNKNYNPQGREPRCERQKKQETNILAFDDRIFPREKFERHQKQLKFQLIEFS